MHDEISFLEDRNFPDLNAEKHERDWRARLPNRESSLVSVILASTRPWSWGVIAVTGVGLGEQGGDARGISALYTIWIEDSLMMCKENYTGRTY